MQPNQSQPQSSVMPPEAVSAAPSIPTNKAVTLGSSGGSGFPKKLIFILLGLIVVIGLGAVIVGIVLPKLRGGSVGESGDITWWGLWEDDSMITPIIAEYEKANPGVKITYVRQSKEDYRERLQSAMSKGDAPDIFRIHNTWVPMFKGQLDTLPSSVMSSQEFASTFYPVAVSDLTTSSGIVGIPLEYDGLALFINEDIFATYGATIPTSWNDLRDIAKALTIKNEKGVITQSGVALGKTQNIDNWQDIIGLMLLQNGADLTKLNDDQTRKALLFFKQFSDIDHVWDETQPNSTVAFATGKLAMYIGPSWRAFDIISQNPALKFKVVSVPQVPKSTPDEKDITYASYWAESVWNKSKAKDAAWRFLKFLSTKEELAKLYENASKIRKFGEPYPRQDMRDMLLSDPIVGGFLELAPYARSWYLASRTFDGDTGINTSLSGYFEDAIGKDANVDTLSLGVRTVLSRYGLAAPIPTPQK